MYKILYSKSQSKAQQKRPLLSCHFQVVTFIYHLIEKLLLLGMAHGLFVYWRPRKQNSVQNITKGKSEPPISCR